MRHPPGAELRLVVNGGSTAFARWHSNGASTAPTPPLVASAAGRLDAPVTTSVQNNAPRTSDSTKSKPKSPTADEKPDYAKIRVQVEVLRGKFASTDTRWFFALSDDAEGRWKKGQMIGFEVTPDKDKDPCEVCLSHYKDFGGRLAPSKMTVRKVDKIYAEFELKKIVTK